MFGKILIFNIQHSGFHYALRKASVTEIHSVKCKKVSSSRRLESATMKRTACSGTFLFIFFLTCRERKKSVNVYTGKSHTGILLLPWDSGCFDFSFFAKSFFNFLSLLCPSTPELIRYLHLFTFQFCLLLLIYFVPMSPP